MQKQKLRLDDLQVESFITFPKQSSQTLEIVGASGLGNRWCTTTFYTETPEACETVGCNTQQYTCTSFPPPPPTGENPTCGRDCY